VEGLFLSAGIFAGGVNTQNHLIDTAEILRAQLGYRGYLHLKIMPGAERDQVLRAMQLSNRVSINLEAPNPKRLARLAPTKQFFDELFRPLLWIEDIRLNIPHNRGWNNRWPSSTTQFVVGAAGESDLEILRDYGFDLEDLPFSADGRLPMDQDPKIAYAQVALVEAPVEVNRADRIELLRVPGIGPKGASSILKARRLGHLRSLSDLCKLGVLAERASPYITLNGRRPPQQMPLL
jgi:predicted DNA-binding helix-hairpin-helix protein